MRWVPLVFGHLAGGDLGARDAVALGVVGVVVDAVGEEFVVGADDVAAADAVAVFVVGVGFVGLVVVVGAGELARKVVGVVDGAVENGGEGGRGDGGGVGVLGGVEELLVGAGGVGGDGELELGFGDGFEVGLGGGGLLLGSLGRGGRVADVGKADGVIGVEAGVAALGGVAVVGAVGVGDGRGHGGVGRVDGGGVGGVLGAYVGDPSGVEAGEGGYLGADEHAGGAVAVLEEASGVDRGGMLANCRKAVPNTIRTGMASSRSVVPLGLERI